MLAAPSPSSPSFLLRSDLIALCELVESNAQYEEEEEASYWLSVAERLSSELCARFPRP